MKNRGMFFLGVVLMSVSSCAFKESAEDIAARLNNGPAPARFQLTSVYSDKNSEQRALRQVGSALITEIPVILPLPAPKEWHITVSMPTLSGMNPEITAAATVDDAHFKLDAGLSRYSVTPDSFEAEITVNGIQEKLDLKPDLAFAITVTIYTSVEQRAVTLSVRTPPQRLGAKTIAAGTVKPRGQILSENVVLPLRTITLTNYSSAEVVATIPHQVPGTMYRGLQNTSYSQGDRCSVRTTIEKFRVARPGRFLLVPDGTRESDLTNLANDPRGPTFGVRLAPKTTSQLSLVWVAQAKHATLEKTGRCEQKPEQKLVAACHNTNCIHTHDGRPGRCIDWSLNIQKVEHPVLLASLDMRGIIIAMPDMPRCSAREYEQICDAWNTEPNAPTGFSDETSILGVAYEIEEPFRGVQFKYADIPIEVTNQAASVEPSELRTTLAGTVDFQMPIKRVTGGCNE